jgi:beta-xylosidase
MALIATTGLLAPTIRWHNGTFYIICTNAAHTSDGQSLDTRNFYVTTKDIWSGTWSDPIFYDFQGIDPSIFLMMTDEPISKAHGEKEVCLQQFAPSDS